MKHGLLYTIGLIVVAMSAFVASPGNVLALDGPYYGTPAWDQTLACTTTANCPRFIVLSNMGSAAVLDRETGLVWEKSPSTSRMSWLSAQAYCVDLTVGNRKGWRLPTIQELASLVDPTQSSPALPAGHPFNNVGSSFFWSATTAANDATAAWGMGFRNGGAEGGDKPDINFVWCTRGGQGVDPQ